MPESKPSLKSQSVRTNSRGRSFGRIPRAIGAKSGSDLLYMGIGNSRGRRTLHAGARQTTACDKINQLPLRAFVMRCHACNICRWWAGALPAHHPLRNVNQAQGEAVTVRGFRDTAGERSSVVDDIRLDLLCLFG